MFKPLLSQRCCCCRGNVASLCDSCPELSLQSSPSASPSCSSWGCCLRSTPSSCTSSSSWTSTCSGATVSEPPALCGASPRPLRSEAADAHRFCHRPSLLPAASTSLLSALYSILRSIVAVALLYGFCYGALKVTPPTIPPEHLPA